MGRRTLRRLLLVTVATLYSGGALWLAFVLMRHAQLSPPQQSAIAKPSDSANARPGTPTLSTPVPASYIAAREILADLRARELLVPVMGVQPDDLHDSFTEARSGHTHEALDILAARGTPVVAIEDGRIARLFSSKAGGITIYQFDPTERYVYYYAHLDRYAEGLREGDTVKRGQTIAYVGTSGNAPEGTPHLHFAILELGPEKHWWEGTPINPFHVWR